MSENITVRVEGARKADAGRGIARLPPRVQNQLGILSGDPVIIEGTSLTVAKVWPGDDDGPVIRIDADTRASVGANIGDTVQVRNASVETAEAVTLRPADDHADTTPAAAAISRKLVDRLVREGKQLRIDGYGGYVVTETVPNGSVRLTDATTVTVEPEPATPS
ncbi:MAG: cell division protein 48 (CDC48), N-terminal domain protein, partial [halophilic archaeon J07HX5]